MSPTNPIVVNLLKRGKKFGVAQLILHYNLKKVSLKYYTPQKTAKYNKNQLEQVTKKYRKIRRQIAIRGVNRRAKRRATAERFRFLKFSGSLYY